MAKFSQSVTRTPKTKAEKEALLKSIKKDFSKFKNPLASLNPFKDGEELEILGIVPVHWEHPNYGEGDYLALEIKNKSETLALTSLVKEVTGYKSADLKDTTPEDFANSGGLSAILSGGWSEDTFDKLLKAITDKPKWKVKLTYYYINRGDNRKKCSLTNLV